VSLLSYDFMQRALVAAVLVGVAAPAIGIFLVQRRLSLMGDGIGHAVFTGVAVALAVRAAPVVGAVIAASGAAVAIELLRERGRTTSDVALALIFYGGIAGGALFTYLAGAGARITEYLFGSLVTTTTGDVYVTAAICALALTFSLGLRRQLFAVCYDDEIARASGLSVRALNVSLALVTALTVVATMRVVGVLLVSALLVLPVAATQQLTSSFAATLGWSLAVGVVLTVGGLVASFYADVVPGATIVLGGIAAFAVAAVGGRLLPARGGGAGS
jgi:zinc transport system permease protein